MSDDYKIQASFKFGVGSTGLLNIRANSVDELKVTVGELSASDLLGDLTGTNDLIRALDNVSLAGMQPTVVPAADPPPQQAQQTPLQALREQALAGLPQQPATAPPTDGWGAPQQPPAAAPPASAPPTCLHGARTYVTGNKDGRAWAAWMCPTPKGAPDKCAPDWI